MVACMMPIVSTYSKQQNSHLVTSSAAAIRAKHMSWVCKRDHSRSLAFRQVSQKMHFVTASSDSLSITRMISAEIQSSCLFAGEERGEEACVKVLQTDI